MIMGRLVLNFGRNEMIDGQWIALYFLASFAVGVYGARKLAQKGSEVFVAVVLTFIAPMILAAFVLVAIGKAITFLVNWRK